MATDHEPEKIRSMGALLAEERLHHAEVRKKLAEARWLLSKVLACEDVRTNKSWMRRAEALLEE